MENTEGKFILSGAAEFQQGSIVSKILLKKQSGNITLFAFDKGQGLSEHTAPFDAFVQAVAGEADVKISGRSYLLSAGEAIIMPAGKPHSVSAVTEFKMLLVMIKEE